MDFSDRIVNNKQFNRILLFSYLIKFKCYIKLVFLFINKQKK